MADSTNPPLKKITERSAEIFVPAGNKISKELPVFYNPVMKWNRDITILLLSQFPPLKICDVLSASGIRAIRCAKELKTVSITANDLNPLACQLIQQNMLHNGVSFEITNTEGSKMLLDSHGFDYIDIDPFGSPNPFLDAAIKRISRNGILAVTATDTSGLCGTHPNACRRKYWAVPLHGCQGKEVALRILIRKIQLVAAQYDKALIPIFSYAHQHYFRVFLQAAKSRKEVAKIIPQHDFYKTAGPLWTGLLGDTLLAEKIHAAARQLPHYASDTELISLLKIIADESKISSVGIFDTHALCKLHRIAAIPKKETLIAKIIESGFAAGQTHLNGHSIRSTIPETELIKILKSL